MNYEALFVDWDGTLSTSRFWERWRDDPVRTDDYAKIQRALFNSATGRTWVKRWMTGYQDQKRVLGEVSGLTNIPYEELADELRYSAEHMQLIDPNVLESIKRLRECGKLVILATDNMDTFDKWTVPSLKLHDHFDDILVSNKERVLKAESSTQNGSVPFFKRYLDKNGIMPEASVLIDDSLDTRQAVQQISMQFMHVTPEYPLSYHLDTIEQSS